MTHDASGKSHPATSGLTPQQVSQFLNDGCLVVHDLLPVAAIQPLIDELTQRVEDGVRAAVDKSLLEPSKTYDNASFDTRLAWVSAACSDPNWIWRHSLSNQKPRSAGMFALRTYPALLDATESVIGPEIFAHPQFNFRARIPNQDITIVAWHQDLAYLVPEDAGDTLVLNFWIPLVDATETNGCMQIIPGSHRFGFLPHDYRDPTPGHLAPVGIEESDLPPGDIVTAELAVGDVLLTTERLIHRGLPNRAKTVRWSVDSRYSRIGLPTGRENVPGFIARSREHPERVAQSHRDWERPFENADQHTS